MTQLDAGNISSAFSQIAQRLDAVGRKRRVQQVLHGLMCWVVIAAAASLGAAATAHLVGAGFWAKATFVLWGVLLAAATWRYLLRPLLIRSDPAAVARLVESRIDGLHDGLTNALLLSRRSDLAPSPWLPEIYDEILRNVQSRPLQTAVRLADLRPALIRTLLLLAGLAILAVFFWGPLTHGRRQLFSPTAFVPTVGDARIVRVQPGDIQVVLGRPLELTVVAEAPRSIGQASMKIVFAPVTADATDVLPLPRGAEALPSTVRDIAGSDQTSLRYIYRVDRLERSLRYRVELAGTQSEWFTATVIRDVKLQDLSLKITPPAYRREASRTIGVPAAEVGKTPIAAPEGSSIELSATLDTPVDGAVLQAGDPYAELAPMAASQSNRRFTGVFTLVRDTPIVVLLTDAAGQAMFRVPNEPLLIVATKDVPPTVEMKWPRHDLSIAPDAAIEVVALLRDDHGLWRGRVKVAVEAPAPAVATASPAAAETKPTGSTPDLTVVAEQTFAAGVMQGELRKVIDIPPASRRHGAVVHVQVEATDCRALGAPAATAWARLRPGVDAAAVTGPQTTLSPVYQVRLQDPAYAAGKAAERADALRKRLLEMLETQKSLHAATVSATDIKAFKAIGEGQFGLRSTMQQAAETFEFAPGDAIVGKTLLMLSIEPAKEAVDLALLLQSEPAAAERQKLLADLKSRQRRIIESLERLLAMLNRSADPTTQPSGKPGGDVLSRADAFKKLDEALQSFIRQQQRTLDQTALLAKKPLDNFTDADRKLLEELRMAQERLDAFMEEKVHQVSKLAEQDMANSSLLMEMMELYAEVTMAKQALKAQALTEAVAAEDISVELATEIRTNMEKWLAERPDRTKWSQGDPPEKVDLPMAELPKELEDIIGELLEQEEDLFDDVEDINANWHSSTDKGAGWEALDGPISNMTAKGVSGNQLPNNNEMPGRSGEGRTGRSLGEFVEETASGKGGRRTPTRLDPTPFQQGQVKDQGSDPTGGATGGGKISGQGGTGLEGPVPPRQQEQMQRLAQQQAQLRNAAERLNLQYRLGRYDNFKLLESIALMRRVEADLNANRYQTALRRKDLLLDRMDTSRLLLGAQVHVKQDTTPTGRNKERKEIGDAMKGELPPAWKDALKAYYEKLASE